jgi:hypothetical protein
MVAYSLRIMDVRLICSVPLILSSTEVAGIHASTLIISRVGIPLLRFHPHPSQCRSIGQAIGLTACSPQRAAIFKTPTASLCASKPQSKHRKPRKIPCECLERQRGHVWLVYASEIMRTFMPYSSAVHLSLSAACYSCGPSRFLAYYADCSLGCL